MDSAVYPSSAVERAMKVQEVILRAIDGRLKWYHAAEILGISDRQMRRWKHRYERVGYDGLFDRCRQQPSPKRVPLAVVCQVLTLYRERYFDYNVLHFHEKLQAVHGIPLSYTWVKTALQTAGLVAKEARRGTHRKARPRRPLAGMLLHADASTHPWVPGLEGSQDLIAVLDDATSAAYYARFVPQENTRTMLAALHAVIEGPGVFCALYTDRGSHFINRTWTVPADGAGTAFVPYTGGQLDRVCAVQHDRVVGNDNCVQFGKRRLQIPTAAWRDSFATCRVKVYEHLNGTLSIGHGPHTVGHYDAEGRLLAPASQSVGQAA